MKTTRGNLFAGICLLVVASISQSSPALSMLQAFGGIWFLLQAINIETENGEDEQN